MSRDLHGAQIVDQGISQRLNSKHVAYDQGEDLASRRRSSVRDVLPIDDEVHQYFPCPVPKCDAVYQNRAERSYHIRTDHPGYKWCSLSFRPEGDGMEKIREHHPNPLPHYEVEEEEEEDILDVDGEPSYEPEKLNLNAVLSDYSEEHDVQNQKHIYQVSMSEDKNEWSNQIANQYMMEQSTSHGQEHLDGPFVQNEEIYKRNILTGPRRRGRPKNPPGSEPAANSKVRIPDPTGKYRCYIRGCPWRGGYRSIRAEHMKWCHKDWKMPPRYLLHKLSQNDYYYENPPAGEFPCPIEGCEWRGNYRASRSSHMRSQHPEFQPQRKKADKGGYVEDGKYLCHDPSCNWKGSSRSTRASHMKREHPGYLTTLYQPKMILCPDCNAACITHKVFVDHLVKEHWIGGGVRREFAGIQDYEEWYEAVQDTFSVEFVKKMGLKQNESYQITYLYCAKSNHYRPKKIKANPYVSQYMKEQNLISPARSRNHCAAFLRVLHWNDGKITVQGCVEHTGHRLGTSILRLSPAERDILEYFIYVLDDSTPLENMLEKFREMENYVIDGYNLPIIESEQVDEYTPDEIMSIDSIKKVLESDLFPPNSAFDVRLPSNLGEDADISVGIMTDEMKNYLRNYGDRTMIFQEVCLFIETWKLHLVFVLVFAEDNSPRCCCLHISKNSNRLKTLKKLQEVFPQPPQTIISDALMDWGSVIEAYGEIAYNTEILIGDWNLLPDWATSLDSIVQNRVDRFTIFACLRRLLRVTDKTLFDAYILEMFDAFRELDIEEMSGILDSALSDPEFFKRWNPLARHGITEHANPMLDIADRNFRQVLCNGVIYRLDKYLVLLMLRLPKFNETCVSEPVAHGTIEAMRSIPIYEIHDPTRTLLADGTEIVGDGTQDHVIIETELDEHGREYIVDDKSQLITDVIEEGEYTEEIEEEIVMDIEEDPSVLPSSSTSIIYEDVPGSSGSYVEGAEVANSLHHMRTIPVVEMAQQRKNRVSMLLETIQRHPEQLKVHHWDLLENSLSQVVQQFDQPSKDGST